MVNAGYPVVAEIFRNKERLASDSQIKVLTELGVEFNRSNLTRVEASKLMAKAHELRRRKETLKKLYQKLKK